MQAPINKHYKQISIDITAFMVHFMCNDTSVYTIINSPTLEQEGHSLFRKRKERKASKNKERKIRRKKETMKQRKKERQKHIKEEG
jgi:hypothetical protein